MGFTKKLTVLLCCCLALGFGALSFVPETFSRHIPSAEAAAEVKPGGSEAAMKAGRGPTPVPPPASTADPTAMPPANPYDKTLREYYDELLKPQMDIIGDYVRSLPAGKAEMENAFTVAKEAAEELDTLCKAREELNGNIAAMNALQTILTNLIDGGNYAKGVTSPSDPAVQAYLQNTAAALLDFKTAVESLFGIFPDSPVVL